MIESYEQYLRYLEADRIALRRNRYGLIAHLTDGIWRYQRLLRKTEYYYNCRKGAAWALYRKFLSFRLQRCGRYIGVSIGLNCFGPGLSIAHAGTIVVNPLARIGANCRLHVCVNIGEGPDGEVPRLGDNCYIGPGVKIFGGVVIGDNTAIGANAVVNRSFPEGNLTIGGVPAKKISDKNSLTLLSEKKKDTGDVHAAK